MFEGVKVIAFDADDTLWSNEPLFRLAESRWAEVLRDYGTPEELTWKLYAVESDNMEDYGYGAKAFTLSLLETACKVTGGNLTGSQTEKILSIGRELLHNPSTPLEGVETTLDSLRKSGKYYLVVLTKGDLLDQEKKVERSGLGHFFDHVRVISNKSRKEYMDLCKDLDINMEELLSIGNSFKSDVMPVLQSGGWGIHIPCEVLWEHEKTEEFDHPRLLKVNKISEITEYLL